jgi:1-acyl-sn-glycerol-3-phosphate acyltransferase
LLPAGAAKVRGRRSVVTVRIGVPVHAGSTAASVGSVGSATAEARRRVVMLAAGQGEGRQDWQDRVAALPGRPLADAQSRLLVERFAVTWYGALLAGVWAFGEALSWPLLPELLLAVVCVAVPSAGARLSLGAAVGSVLGGAAGYVLAAHGIIAPEPVTTTRMHAAVVAQVTAHGAAAVLAQPLSGIPFKVYVAAAGTHHVGLGRFLLDSGQARGARILGFGLAVTGLGACVRRWRRFYPAYLVAVAGVYIGGWAAVVAAWS